MSEKQQMKLRQRDTKIWIKWFKEKWGRKPTNEEGQIFGQAFNMGWNAKQERNRINREIKNENTTNKNIN